MNEQEAWVRFIGMWDPDKHECSAADWADGLLKLYRTRFPAPVEREAEPTPTEPDWIDHTPGQPMPCEGEQWVLVRKRDGMQMRCRAYAAVWDSYPKVPAVETVAWKPAQ